MELQEKKGRRIFGHHFTSKEIFETYIRPQIRKVLFKYTWIDLYCGSGNLILPILELIPKQDQCRFFQEHLFLCDIQQKCVEEAVQNALTYNIPEKIVRQNIYCNDSLRNHPSNLNSFRYPLFHITNPPYLYLGYIAKHKETGHYRDLFTGQNQGFQDLYQIALINDRRHHFTNMIYIVPSNFLFGNVGTNKIRTEIFPYYWIRKAFIFEHHIFEHTGMNVMICFFNRKVCPKNEEQVFKATKINHGWHTRRYRLNPQYQYQAGMAFDEFCMTFQDQKPLKFHYYLMKREIDQNKGKKKVVLVDVNAWNGKTYEQQTSWVNTTMHDHITHNKLWIRTIDTGKWDGRAGLYLIPECFNADGLLVTKKTSRTNPIPLFFDPLPSIEVQHLIYAYFNLILEYLRNQTDSEFMTTYKYSENTAYTRKYLGLSQTKKLLATFPYSHLHIPAFMQQFRHILNLKDTDALLQLLENIFKKKYSYSRTRLTPILRLDHWLI